MSDITPKNILFLSDLHLGGFADDINEQLEDIFAGLINTVLKEQAQLVILGDLLDYYMQYGSDVPEYARGIFLHLEKFNRSSPYRSIYITGNHDNWDEGYLQSIGFDVEHEYKIMELDGKKVLLAHGDGLSDPALMFPRPIFHRLLRNPYFVKVYRSITTPESGNRIMKKFSQLNRHFSTEKESDTNRIDKWAEFILKSGIADVVICGHHHHIRFINYNEGLYINTGAFFRQFCCAKYTNSMFQLVKWDNNNKKFDRVSTEGLTYS